MPVRINELSEAESDAMLDYLFRHQLEARFRYKHDWNENDLLIWDHLGTIHRAIADYGPDEIRLMRRCQVMATKVFDPAFLRPALEASLSEGMPCKVSYALKTSLRSYFLIDAQMSSGTATTSRGIGHGSPQIRFARYEFGICRIGGEYAKRHDTPRRC